MVYLQGLLVVSLVVVCAAVSDFNWKDTHSSVVVGARQQFLADLVKGMNSPSFVPAGAKSDLAIKSFAQKGLVYVNYHLGFSGSPDTTCSTVDAALLFPANMCHMGGPNFFMKFQILQDGSCDGAVIQYFKDPDCLSFLGTSDLSGYTDCAQVGAPLGEDPYRTLICSASVTPTFDESFYIEEEYEDKACSSRLGSAVAFRSKACVSLRGIAVSYDCTTSTPKLSAYNYSMSNACDNASKLGSSFTSPTTCALTTDDDDDADDDDDDDYVPDIINPPPGTPSKPIPPPKGGPLPVYTVGFCPQKAPSPMPVRSPTAFPTSATKSDVSFDVSQDLVGIDAETFTSKAKIQDTVIKTIADSMTGTKPEDITDFIVTDQVSRRRRLGASVSLQATSSSAVSMQYTVSTSTTLSAAQLHSELSDVVASGAFTSALAANADAAGADDLQGCSSTYIAEGDSSSKQGLSQGAIIAIAVGGAAFVAFCIGVLIHKFCFSQNPNKVGVATA